jgi:hypothetical protein
VQCFGICTDAPRSTAETPHSALDLNGLKTQIHVEQVWLFELRSDPEERHNLATERPDLVETMGRRVDELTMESARSSGDVTVERSKLNGRRFIAAIEARKLLPGIRIH